MPTAPAILPTAIASRARPSARAARGRPRRTSRANTRPAVIGSAWMPCERPIIGVARCSRARVGAARRAARRRRARIWSSRVAQSAARATVSSTSDDVMPRCSQRAGSPASSSTWVRNAITSWRVRSSISRMRAGSSLPARLRAHGGGGAGRDRARGSPSPRRRPARRAARSRSGGCRTTARATRDACSGESSVRARSNENAAVVQGHVLGNAAASMPVVLRASRSRAPRPRPTARSLRRRRPSPPRCPRPRTAASRRLTSSSRAAT